jgi:hypothetical protein
MPLSQEHTLQPVASYTSYGEAQAAVDYLSDRKFPVQSLAIVATDLRFVEQVTGRRGYLQAALGGAGQGALIGLIFGWLIGLFSLVDPLVSALALTLWGVVIGAVLGAIFGLLGHAMSGGRRDFSSVGGLEAEGYAVMADPAYAEEASRLLAEREPTLIRGPQ